MIAIFLNRELRPRFNQVAFSDSQPIHLFQQTRDDFAARLDLTFKFIPLATFPVPLPLVRAVANCVRLIQEQIAIGRLFDDSPRHRAGEQRAARGASAALRCDFVRAAKGQLTRRFALRDEAKNRPLTDGAMRFEMRFAANSAFECVASRAAINPVARIVSAVL